MGPYEPGLKLVQIMLSTFEKVVNYHHYRLTYTTSVPTQTKLRNRYKPNTQVDGLYPVLGYFLHSSRWSYSPPWKNEGMSGSLGGSEGVADWIIL